MHEPDALDREGSQTIGGGADRCPEALDTGTRIDRRLDFNGVNPHARVGENETEGVRAGRLEDEVCRQIERARPGGGSYSDDALTDVLGQRLNARIQRDAEAAVNILMTPQDIGSTRRYRIANRNRSRRLVRDDRPRKYSALGDRRGGSTGPCPCLGSR